MEHSFTHYNYAVDESKGLISNVFRASTRARVASVLKNRNNAKVVRD